MILERWTTTNTPSPYAVELDAAGQPVRATELNNSALMDKFSADPIAYMNRNGSTGFELDEARELMNRKSLRRESVEVR